MADITTSEVTDIDDPKLRAIAKRVVKVARIAAEKAVAHHADPGHYPITAATDSLEQIFLSRFKELHPVKQQAAVVRVMALVKASEATRIAAYGDLAKVNLQSAASVSAQVNDLAFPPTLKFPASHLNSLIQIQGGVAASAGLSPLQATTHLELRIHKVKCVDETGVSLPILGEPGHDDMHMGGSTIDETGDTHKISDFKVGDFEDGVVKTYSPPKQFAWFNMTEGTAWPKRYFVTLVLSEQDWGGFGKFLNDLVDKIKATVQTALAAAVGGLLGMSGGPVGAAIGMVIGFAVGKIFEFLKGIWSDDVFAPAVVDCNVGSLTSRFPGHKTDSTERLATFKGHDGKYEVTYDWRLYA